ncbi:hypothetical protein [Terrabacter sp. MAHUQ-38]|jgi:hypothetical protein|uniref:hypothetical protein n=1 Tax=unclassified Terrabacter TaxID=2630222 RepID=UPI00165DF923|nr:hypothetical protein [Terrabacter sp. MAHUQ-38]MBC9821038.1 hypothetical protein [Terrabacter sp. MAHUQ-38]
MDAALAGLLGTAIGAVAGIAGSLLSSRHQMRLERERIDAARHDELTRAARQSLLDLVQLVATGTQAIAWVTWAVECRPVEESLVEARRYEDSMRELLPRLVSAQVAVASLSAPATYERLDPLVRTLVHLDARVGTALVGHEQGDATSTAELLALRDETTAFEQHTVAVVRAILSGVSGD